MWMITRDDRELDASEPSAAGRVCSCDWEECPAHRRDIPTFFTFRLLDDDGNVYYHGRNSAIDLRPLDEYGTGNDGCTAIQYRVKGHWETL